MTLDPTTKFEERFEVANRLEDRTARYNIAPTQAVPVIVRNSPNRIVMMRWGLIPYWAHADKIPTKMFNARAETITEKVSFKRLLPSRRCIVPASGYYEWQATENGKQPYYIHADAGEYLPFAGLYDIWKNPEGREIYSCTIITTQPTASLQAIHTRMPVILEPKAEAVWLNADVTDPKELTPLLHPYEVRALDFYPVSKAVNRAGFESPDLIRKVDA
jgi:putative SOS response-associated peptidase YedK